MGEERRRNEGLLKFFNFGEPVSISGGTSIPLSNAAETPLAVITLRRIRFNDRVLIQADVGWQISPIASIVNPEVRFRIHRDSVLGPVVFDTIDSGTGLGSRFNTALIHAEIFIPRFKHHQYILTAFIATGAPSDVFIIGPINLSGSVIGENERERDRDKDW
jgi:hypothetical protein